MAVKLGTLGMSFNGICGGMTGQWTPTQSDVSAAISAGVGRVSIPCYFSSDLAIFTSMIKMFKNFGLSVHIVLHFDGADSVEYGTAIYTNFPVYQKMFNNFLLAAAAGGLASGDTCELWNEASLQKSWAQVATLYKTNAPTLAAMVRSILPGVSVVLPGPIDQSPESFSNSWAIGLAGLFNPTIYDYFGVHLYCQGDWGGSGADVLGWPVPGCLKSLWTRLEPVIQISSLTGMKVMVTEFGPPLNMSGYQQWGVDAARILTDLGWQYFLWDWHDLYEKNGVFTHDYRSVPAFLTAMIPVANNPLYTLPSASGV